jgi:dTDP-4-dehydrorhamnose reductase
LAVFVIEAALDYGPPFEIKFENILPISAADYLTPVRRPYNSRLNNTKLKMALLEISFTGKYPHWREQVKEYVKDFMSTMLKK